MIRSSFFLLVSIALLAVGLPTFKLGAAENTGVAADAQVCTEPGACGDDDSNSGNVSTDPSSDSEPNTKQTKEDSSEQTNVASSEQTSECESSPAIAAAGRDGVRLISCEELALHTGKDGASPENPIWLSILGKVYDVTTGEDYYGEEKGGYRYYAGRDASPCFSSGKNNAEGAAEDWTKWDDEKLVPILEWARFYQDHETYKYLGLFAGSKWFDENGEQTALRKEFVGRAVPKEIAMHEEKEKKKAERIAARLAKKKEREEKEKKKQK